MKQESTKLTLEEKIKALYACEEAPVVVLEEVEEAPTSEATPNNSLREFFEYLTGLGVKNEPYISEELNEALITLGRQAYPKFGTVVIMAGGAGSGKGFVSERLLGVEGKVLDVDAMKLLTMKAPGIIAKVKKDFGTDISKLDLKNPANVSKLHELLADFGIIDKKEEVLFSSILSADVQRKPNIIFDVTMKDQKKFTKLCDQVVALGYKKENIHLVWVVNDINVAMAQNQARSRVVPEDILQQTHMGASETVLGLMKDSALIARYMDGDIVLAFNKAKVDAELATSEKKELKESGGSYIVKANYVYVKRKGRPPLALKDFGIEILNKIIAYTPAKELWSAFIR